MFGMGFTEIMIIAVVAVIFLGPDKLPDTMINIAKFFRSMKTTVANAKDSLEQELHVSELKEEALNYKKELMSASSELDRVTSMANLDDEYDYVHDTVSQTTKKLGEESIKPATATPVEPEKVTFEKKKKKKKKNKENEEDNA